MPFHHVIKPRELSALNYLPSSHPRPIAAQWINRGTDRPLRKQSVDLLVRTLFADDLSESVIKLHQSSGLRADFRSDSERLRFAREFAAAKAIEQESCASRITMMFNDQAAAAMVAEELIASGIPKRAVSLLWRAGRFMDADTKWVEGHSLLSVTGATTGGSLTGLAVGVALIAVPGIGQIAAIGGLAASTATSVPALLGIFGATAAAVRKMMSDADVEDVAQRQFVERCKTSHVFISVDCSASADSQSRARQIMESKSGRLVTGSMI